MSVCVAVVCLNSDHWITVAILGVCPYHMLIDMYSFEHLVISLGSDGRGVVPRPLVVILKPNKTICVRCAAS